MQKRPHFPCIFGPGMQAGYPVYPRWVEVLSSVPGPSTQRAFADKAKNMLPTASTYG